MRKYYAIYPGPHGLITKCLGEHADLGLASVVDVFDERASERRTSIWIANDTDMAMLYLSIKRTMKYDA